MTTAGTSLVQVYPPEHIPAAGDNVIGASGKIPTGHALDALRSATAMTASRQGGKDGGASAGGRATTASASSAVANASGCRLVMVTSAHTVRQPCSVRM